MTTAALAVALTLGAAQATGQAAPDLVLTAPAGSDLRSGWTWAESTAGSRGFERYWIAWTVAGDTTGATWYFADRHAPVAASASIVLGSIRISGSGGGLSFAGVKLSPLVGSRSPHETVFLLRFARSGGRSALERVHTGSFAFPVHFDGGALLWLGAAADPASVAALRTAFDATDDDALRRDLVGAVGTHMDAETVTGGLRAWLENDALPVPIRREAADWLGRHPHANAVTALTRAARSDTSNTVRGAALRGLARAAPATTAVPELVRLSRDDADAAIRRSAVSALGTIRDDLAFRALVQILEQPGDSAVRRQAVSSVRQQVAPAGPRQPREIIDLLARVARNDSVASVRTTAVDVLASLRDPRTTPILADLARNHTDARVQQRATQALGRAEPPDDALDPLRQIAWEHARPEVQSAAVRALVQIGTDPARRLLADIAERHARPEIRRAALQAVVNQRFR